MDSNRPFNFTLTALILSVMAYGWIGYGLDRTHFAEFLIAISLAFIGYVVLYRTISPNRIGSILIGALGLRLIFLFALPELSDDYQRFIWDGRMMSNGLSPYEYVPSAVPDSTQAVIDPQGQLLEGMNSPDYYSVYPPLHQGVFLLSAWLGSSTTHSVVVMRLILLLIEGLFIFLLYRIGLRMDRPKAVLLYAFNPLVIVEISGNLHFEGMVAFFLIAGLNALHAQRRLWSGFFLGIAAAIKLTPFIYFPAIIKYAWERGVGIRLVTAALFTFCLAGWWFFPFEQWLGIGSSIGLYFQSFEFNASFYYLARGLGILWLGYNPIATTGWLLPMVGMLIILTISLMRYKDGLKQTANRLVIIGAIYLLFATTVHPWYLIPLIALSVFSRYSFPLVWSLFIALSYSAYSNPNYTEIPWLLVIEYVIVSTWFLLELFNPKLIHSWNQKIWGEIP